MRVAFYAPMKPPTSATPSGDGRMAQLFLRALGGAGFETTLASTFRSYEGSGDAGRQSDLASQGAQEAERLLAGFRNRATAERPAVWFTYHLYHKAPDHLGPKVAAALGIPYVVAEASHAPKQMVGPWASGYSAAEAAIRAAERIYCLNPVDRACLKPLVKSDTVLRDLPPFIDTAPFRAGPEAKAAARAAVLAAYGLDPALPLLLTVAMMRRDQKLRSYAVLAGALAALSQQTWQLLVVGSGPAEAEVCRLMRPVSGRVAFAGRLDGAALIQAYRAADIYAWPSVKEAFGLAFVEAAASGAAIVAGRSGGIDAIVDEGRTGFVVPAGDAPMMARRLGQLLADPCLARRVGAAGAERAGRVNDVAGAAGVLRADLRALASRRAGRDPHV